MSTRLIEIKHAINAVIGTDQFNDVVDGFCAYIFKNQDVAKQEKLLSFYTKRKDGADGNERLFFYWKRKSTKNPIAGYVLCVRVPNFDGKLQKVLELNFGGRQTPVHGHGDLIKVQANMKGWTCRQFETSPSSTSNHEAAEADAGYFGGDDDLWEQLAPPSPLHVLPEAEGVIEMMPPLHVLPEAEGVIEMMPFFCVEDAALEMGEREVMMLLDTV